MKGSWGEEGGQCVPARVLAPPPSPPFPPAAPRVRDTGSRASRRSPFPIAYPPDKPERALCYLLAYYASRVPSTPSEPLRMAKIRLSGGGLTLYEYAAIQRTNRGCPPVLFDSPEWQPFLFISPDCMPLLTNSPDCKGLVRAKTLSLPLDEQARLSAFWTDTSD